jgi:hypothetical protein
MAVATRTPASGSSDPSQNVWPRGALLACGVLAPLLYLASDVVASVRYQGYSYLHQTISELNAIGSPTRGLTVAFGLAGYALLTAFGVGIWRSAAGSRRLRAVGGVLSGFGVLALWAVPFASMPMRGAEQGLNGALHLVAGMVAVLLLLAAMGFASATFGRRFRLYTIATVVVMLAFGAWTGVDGPRIAEGLATPWVGVKERISVYSYQLWLVALALALLRQRRAVRAGRGGLEGMPANVPVATTGAPPRS